MTSPPSDLDDPSTELGRLSLRRHELLQRKKLLLVLKELQGRAEFLKSEHDAHQLEIDSIDEDLRELSQRRAELQSGNMKNVKLDSTQEPSSSSDIFYVESPPTIPAPTVILDKDQLPPCPSRTQCPSCRQYIMTETCTTVSSVTWLACFATAMIGCVAGCCLIPFCLDTCKSTTHKCPKCRTSIITIKRI